MSVSLHSLNRGIKRQRDRERERERERETERERGGEPGDIQTET